MESRLRQVADVMSKNVLTIDGKSTTRDAVKMLKENQVSSLIVSRLDEHDEVGLITIADIARDVVAHNKSLDRVHVLEIMSKPVVSVASDMTLANATRLLARLDISRAVVVDTQRNPVGMVTRSDLVLGCFEDD